MVVKEFVLGIILIGAFKMFTIFNFQTFAIGKHSSIFDFTVDDIKGNPVPLSSFKGKKAYLITNVASQ